MSALFNFDEQFEGDSLPAQVFSVKRYIGGEDGELMDLTGAAIYFEVFRSNTSRKWLERNTNNSGISINDAEACLFTINKVLNPDLTAYNYQHKITIVYPNAEVRTYISGYLPIVKFKDQKDANSCN